MVNPGTQGRSTGFGQSNRGYNVREANVNALLGRTTTGDGGQIEQEMIDNSKRVREEAHQEANNTRDVIAGKSGDQKKLPYDKLTQNERDAFVQLALNRYSPFTPEIWYKQLLDNDWSPDNPARYALAYCSHQEGDFSFPIDPSNNDSQAKKELIIKFYGTVLPIILGACIWWSRVKLDDFSAFDKIAWGSKFILTPYAAAQQAERRTEIIIRKAGKLAADSVDATKNTFFAGGALLAVLGIITIIIRAQ